MLTFPRANDLLQCGVRCKSAVKYSTLYRSLCVLIRLPMFNRMYIWNVRVRHDRTAIVIPVRGRPTDACAERTPDEQLWWWYNVCYPHFYTVSWVGVRARCLIFTPKLHWCIWHHCSCSFYFWNAIKYQYTMINRFTLSAPNTFCTKRVNPDMIFKTGPRGS
jgi:hypothetical protein